MKLSIIKKHGQIRLLTPHNQEIEFLSADLERDSNGNIVATVRIPVDKTNIDVPKPVKEVEE